VTVSSDFLVTALVVALVPGTGVVYTVSNGLFGGRRWSALAAVGCTLGIVPHLLAATLGLSALVHTSARVFQVMKLAGVAYLLYLAWAMWRSTGALSFAPTGVRSGRAVVVRGTVVNLLNPKLTLFFFAFLPQFVRDGRSPATPQLLLLGAVFMAVTLAVFLAYGLMASGLRRRVVGSPKLLQRLQRGFALAFAGLGLRLAAQER
jgi:threonine/homoserine/homoserine lactone efflux protein